jgi:hypothetical protein
MSSCLMGTSLGCQLNHLLTPLYGLMTSRYRRGNAFTPAPGEKGFHLHGYKIVRIGILRRESV